MSIIRAKYKGKHVYADESLRGKTVQCIYCGCNMHIRRYPGREECYFACLEGENHNNAICQRYQDKTNMSVLPKSPEDFLKMLLRAERKAAVPRGTGTHPASDNDGIRPATKMTSLSQLIKTGIFAEEADEKVFPGADLNYIDFIILKKWAERIWDSSTLETIGTRIIEAMWVGSLKMYKKAKEKQDESGKKANDTIWASKMGQFFGKTKELWLTVTVHADETEFIRICVDCKSCFADIKNKLFIEAETYGKYNPWVPRKSKLEMLTFARWAIMGKEDCHEKCPLHMCNNCLGAYWGKCTSPKQVQLIDDKYRF